MQMVGFFARRIEVVSGGGLDPSALSRAATLQTRAVEAAQHPANSKSRRFVCIGASSKLPLTVVGGPHVGAEVFCVDLKAPPARKIPRPRHIGYGRFSRRPPGDLTPLSR